MMKKKWIAAFIIYGVLLAACLIVVYAVPSVKGMLEKTYVAEYGKIDIADEVSAFIVRDETVYVAAEDCDVTRLADTGELVKAKTRAVEVTPVVDEAAEAAKEAGPDADQAEAEAAAEANGESPDNIGRKYTKVIESLGGSVKATEDGRTGEAGYISYFVDGAEAALSTDRLGELSRKDYESLTSLRNVDTADGRVGKGEPLFKVTHNSRWYLVFYIDKEAGEKYYEGRTVSIELDGRKVPVRVASVETGEKTAKIVLSCKDFFEGFPEERTLDTTVTVASAEGLVLQDSSIVMKGDQPGVFVKNKLGEHRFKPVSIKADDGERCVAYSDIYVDEGGNYVETISTYDEIVAEPTEEEIAELQVQAAKEAEEAKKRAEEEAKKAEEEAARAEAEAARAAAAQAAAEQAVAEAAQAEGTESGAEGEAPAAEEGAAQTEDSGGESAADGSE